MGTLVQPRLWRLGTIVLLICYGAFGSSRVPVVLCFCGDCAQVDVPVANMDLEVLLPSYLFFLELCVFIFQVPPPHPSLPLSLTANPISLPPFPIFG